MPKAEPPRTKPGFIRPAAHFGPAARSLTRRRTTGRRIYAKRRGGNVRIRIAPVFRPAATAMLGSTALRGSQSLLSAEQPASVKPESSHKTDTANGREGIPSSGTGDGGDAAPSSSGDAGSSPDVSSEFRGELGGIQVYYAARIAAAKLTYPSHIVAGIVQALMNEQAAATRALMERWQAASEKQRLEGPVRPTQNTGRKNDGTGLS